MPELETDRIRLRRLRREDLHELYEVVLSDAEVTWDGRARTLEETQEALERKLRHVEAHGFGFLAVEGSRHGADVEVWAASTGGGQGRCGPASRPAADPS